MIHETPTEERFSNFRTTMPRISLDGALQELKTMFPQFDDDLLVEVIRQQNGHMENIISYLLILSGDDSAGNIYDRSHSCTTNSLSNSTKNEIDRLEEEYDLDLHRTWRTRLPNDLLNFEIPQGDDDEEIARKLQMEYDEQATQRVLLMATSEGRPQFIDRQNTQNEKSEGSLGKTIAKKSKELKTKFMNFFYERKGYKRVNVSDDKNDQDAMEMEMK